MKKINILLLCLIAFSSINAQYPEGEEILKKVDENMNSENKIFTSSMIVHGRRGDRTIKSRTWTVGEDRAFTEYIYPAREEGTKMLKLEDQLWIYSPSTDRTIQISGHMMRQSVMGSDMSYEDMMEDASLLDNYNAEVITEDKIGDRETWVLELTGKKEDLNYHKRKLWVDKNRYVPLREELFARSGELLKKTEMSEVKNINNRWFPTRIVFKDMLKEGDGTEFIMEEIKFNQDIPEYVFSKASLKK